MSRLDRFLYSSAWAMKFSDHRSRRLCRVTSDHFPIILENSSLNWGPTPFRFDNYLLKEKLFIKNISSWWSLTHQNGQPGYSFIRRLKKLALKVKEWKRGNVDAIKSRKKILSEEIDSINSLEESLHQKRISLKVDLHEAVLQELRFQRQRCKKIWLKEGDENTSLFHKIGSARRRKNFIAELISSNDISLVTDDHLEQEIVDHFNNIYNNIPAPGWMVSNLDWHHISSELAAFLTRPFTEDEVWKNLRSLGHNKSPCPDGFTVEFFKKSWNTLKPSIMSVFHDFFVNGVINRNVNETCIALIPKKAKSLRISEYRPISLTTVLYHLMAKSLAERLKCTLPFSIAENHLPLLRIARSLMPF